MTYDPRSYVDHRGGKRTVEDIKNLYQLFKVYVKRIIGVEITICFASHRGYNQLLFISHGHDSTESV